MTRELVIGVSWLLGLSLVADAIAGEVESATGAAAAKAAIAAPGVGSGDAQLLDVLHAKGVITDQEYEALRQRTDAGSVGAGAEKPAAIQITQKPGYGFTIQTEDKRFATTIMGYLMVRGQYTDADASRSTDDELRFQVRRARVTFDGNLFEPWFKYRIMIDTVGESAVTSVTTTRDTDGNIVDVKTSNSRVAELKDGYFDMVPAEEYGLRFGQFKVPISRQFIISATKLQLPDRSIASETFDYDRDMGLDAHGALAKRFFYDVGVYNGNGENHPSNPDGTEMAYNARAGLVLAGEDPKYLFEQEGDTKIVPDLQAAVEVADVYDLGKSADINTLEVGGLLKFRGLSVALNTFTRHAHADAGSSDDDGYYAQLGYMVTDHLELAVRRSETDLDDVEQDTEHTIGTS